jgi:hypothetical protein
LRECRLRYRRRQISSTEKSSRVYRINKLRVVSIIFLRLLLFADDKQRAGSVRRKVQINLVLGEVKNHRCFAVFSVDGGNQSSGRWDEVRILKILNGILTKFWASQNRFLTWIKQFARIKTLQGSFHDSPKAKTSSKHPTFTKTFCNFPSPASLAVIKQILSLQLFK